MTHRSLPIASAPRKCLFILLVCVPLGLGATGTTAESMHSEPETLTGMAFARPDPFWNDSQEVLGNEERIALQANCAPITDMMEEGPLASNWNTAFMEPRSRFSIQDDYVRQGSRSLAISLFRNDPPFKKSIHKHELRIANDKRCNFGQEVWYSFSFRIEGEYPSKGSTRWVTGQWKEDSDGSPFLAQRFDNGVFHITIQRNDKRELIAASAGNPYEKFEFYSDSFKEALRTGIQGDSPTELRGMLNDPESAAFDVDSFNHAILAQDISRFPFVADPESFSKIAGLKIMPSKNPLLPSPASSWVDMRYRIRGDRDGKGLIEVWANGKFIVKVTGKIGNDVFGGDSQYFKIGHYRDIDSEFDGSIIYFDRFKRSMNRADVD